MRRQASFEKVATQVAKLTYANQELKWKLEEEEKKNAAYEDEV